MTTILVPRHRPLSRPAPFSRKTWDDPRRYKLDHAYGDEFEYGSFAQLQRRWRMVAAVAADFEFPGGSSILWKPSAVGSALTIACPAGDFEAVLEFTLHTAFGNLVQPMLAGIDAVGTGAGVGFYGADANIYAWPLTTYATTTFSGVASGYTGDGRRSWLSMRRTGANYTGRGSNNGSTWTAFTGNAAGSASAPFLSIMRANPSSVATALYFEIHRLNIYPGPTFFPG